MQFEAMSLAPVTPRVQARLTKLSQELLYAWDRTDAALLREWGARSGRNYGRVLTRRTVVLVDLLKWLLKALARETAGAVGAACERAFLAHLTSRSSSAYAALKDIGDGVMLTASKMVDLLKAEPGQAVPQLLTLVTTSLVVSGGLDGDGGAPDLDLMFGIEAHRSIFTHSIILGSALEAGFLSLVELVRLLHAKLPAGHDCLWDRVVTDVESTMGSAIKGAGLGMAYHLFVDALLQPAALKEVPFSMPMEAHQASTAAFAAAEAVDVRHKDALATLQQPAAAPAPRPALGRARDEADEASRARHRVFLSRPFHVPPEVVRDLSKDEWRILSRYGAWMQALAEQRITPRTEGQEQFVAACNGARVASTTHEKAWQRYVALHRTFRAHRGAAD